MFGIAVGNGYTVLAQGNGQAAAMSGLIWIAAIALAVVVAVALTWRLRKSVARPTEAGGVPFSLHEIRRLRDQGDLTIPEYEALRDKLIYRTGHSQDQA